MKHGAHKAAKASRRPFDPAALFASGKGSHRAGSVRMAQLAQGRTVMSDIDAALAAKLNEVAPLTRRSMRQAARAAERRSLLLASASLAALVGTAATTVSLANQQGVASLAVADDATTTTQMQAIGAGSSVSRSEERTALSSQTQTEQSQQSSTSSQGDWQLGDSNMVADVDQLSRSLADNPQVASLVEQDSSLLPQGFDPNHATGDVGNAYEFSQCTWWVYVRRHQLGLPVGSHMGNGAMWARTARSLGYWVDNTPRHVGDIMVFAAGQAGSDPFYGHVAIVEKINPDGSIVTSECGESMQGKTYSRTYTNTSDFQFIHY